MNSRSLFWRNDVPQVGLENCGLTCLRDEELGGDSYKPNPTVSNETILFCNELRSSLTLGARAT